jgi:uncharacterized membrane protein
VADHPRLAYLDGLRGLALIAMVVNHTARAWIEGHMTWSRYALIYVTLSTAAPMFLFLVGFCLPLAVRPGESERLSTLARHFVPRGARIVLGGLLLNVLVFPDQPVLSGGVLQTIGLAIIVMVPALWLVRWPAGGWGLLVVAGLGYVTFVAAYPALQRFVTRHSRLGLVLFYDFPPWPWLSLVLIGLVLGWIWLRAHERDPAAGARLMTVGAGLGGLMVLAFFLYDAWAATPVRFGLRRDFILNRHWTPRGIALAWVLGMILLALAAMYELMERRGWRLRWLVVFGQTALFLYFFHQVIAFRLVEQHLHWHFDRWPLFAAANVVFLLVLLACGWAWRAIKPRLRQATRVIGSALGRTTGVGVAGPPR